MRYLAAILPLLLALPAAAQDEETVYMGIDLTAEPEPVPAPGDGEAQQHSLDGNMRPLLDEGVELGCLAFEPPATFSQTGNGSSECEAYILRLRAASAAGGDSDPAVAATDNPWRAIPLVTLARAAQSGNKSAQLELGIRFEEGVGGLEQDWERADRLYTEAARATPAVSGVAIRQTENREGVPGGGITRRQITPRVPGLPEARERRDALRDRMEAAAGE